MMGIGVGVIVDGVATVTFGADDTNAGAGITTGDGGVAGVA